MADWEDWLTGISGGLSGIVKGIDTGMAPLSTWEGIRNKDLANDRTEIGNEDLYQMQQARMGAEVPDYYGNVIGAQNVGNRLKMASGERDIFGQQQQLGLAEYLSDPNGAFQQGLKETGWTPGTPEYREWLAEAMSMYDPSGAASAYDKMNIPGIEQRNLNEQAALNYIQNWVRQKDPGAQVQRMPDGTVVVVGSDGEMTPVPGDKLVQAAAMMNAKTPYDAISQGLGDEMKIQNTNINLMKAMQDGRITPALAFKYAQEEGVRINQAVQTARQRLQALENNKNIPMMSPEERADHDAQVLKIRSDLERYTAAADRNRQMTSAIVTQTRGGGRPVMHPVTGLPMPGGGALGASVNALRFGQRPPLDDIMSKAAGVGGSKSAPWGASSQGPAYPQRQPSPRDTGIRPITQGNQQMGGMDLNQLIAMLQAFGAMNG